MHERSAPLVKQDLGTSPDVSPREESLERVGLNPASAPGGRQENPRDSRVAR